MPEKDGDEGKSTKSVVNKKQKQMMGEEGYDIARDQGRVRPSKDKKDATTMPKSKRKEVKGDTPMQKEFKKKYGKKATALDAVKQEYKGQIMKVEELDLTQVAEAFGGYIVETNGKKKKFSNNNNKNGQKFDSGAVGTTPSGSPDLAGTQKKFVQQRRQPVDPENVLSQEPVRISDKNFAKLMDRVTGRKTSTQQDAETGEKKKGPADYDRRKILQSPEYYKKKRDQLISKRKEYEIDRQGKATDAGIEKFARTRKQSNLPLSQDDLDSAKKSMVGTGEKGTDVGKYGGKLGRKRGKDQPTFAQVKAGIDDENPVRTSPISGGKIPDTRKPNNQNQNQNREKNVIDFLNTGGKIPGGERKDGKVELPDFVQKRQERRKTFGGMMKDVERSQQKSAVARSGGLLAKTLNPALAGVEAMARYRSGDNRGALISTIQSVGGPVGFAAGVVNALRSRNLGRQAQAQAAGGGKGGGGGKKTGTSSQPSGGKEPAKSGSKAKEPTVDTTGVDALAAYQINKDLADKLGNLRFPVVKGGRAGSRTAG